jgi:hypothetical protein
MSGIPESSGQLLNAVADEFGWSIETVTDFREIPLLADRHRIVAVLFQREAFGPEASWNDALRELRCVLPDARLIPSHGFSDSLDRDLLAEAGAFHFLWLPLKESELRQCIGFVWQTTRSIPATIPVGIERTTRISPHSVEYSAA